MDQLIFASLSHTHYWYEVGMLKVPAVCCCADELSTLRLCGFLSGGQYTNLLFQSQQLGLSGRWPQIKRSYAAANRLLGDIIKVNYITVRCRVYIP